MPIILILCSSFFICVCVCVCVCVSINESSLQKTQNEVVRSTSTAEEEDNSSSDDPVADIDLFSVTR